MSRQNPYVLSNSPTSRCGECKSRMLMLASTGMLPTLPIFFVCPECHTIYESGVGKVMIKKAA